MRISDWISDVCSSDLRNETALALGNPGPGGLMALGPCLDHALGHQDVDAFGIAPDRKGGADLPDADAADVDHEGAVRVVRDLEPRFAFLQCAMAPLRFERDRDAAGGDRKSTRMNSSH